MNKPVACEVQEALILQNQESRSDHLMLSSVVIQTIMNIDSSLYQSTRTPKPTPIPSRLFRECVALTFPQSGQCIRFAGQQLPAPLRTAECVSYKNISAYSCAPHERRPWRTTLTNHDRACLSCTDGNIPSNIIV